MGANCLIFLTNIRTKLSGAYQRAQHNKTLGPSTSQILAGILAILLGGFFFSNSAYAGTNISMSSEGNISFGRVKPSSAGDIVTATDNLNITTDCSAGANIYISAVNGSATGTNLVNNAGSSNNTISTVSGTTVGNSNTAVALSNNTWGFNKTSGSNSYYGLPAYSGSVSNPLYTNAMNGSTLPVYYAAKVTNTLVPGKYTGQVLYTAVISSSCLTYTVVFNKNANDATGTMNNQTIAPAASTPLTSNGFSRPGYTFLGWSTNQNATTATYTNGQSVTDLTTGGGSITLYAIWRANTVTVSFNSNNPISDCSSTVHPTASKGCIMADGNEWIYGNNGEPKTGYSNVAATCPSGYNGPIATDYTNLISAQGNGSELYTVLGLSSSHAFWATDGKPHQERWNTLIVNNSSSYVDYYNRDYETGSYYVLCYKTPDTVSGSMSDQTFTYNTSQALSSNGYSVSGYNFLGWSTDPNATTATYTDGQSVTASQLASNITTEDRNITLYAVWQIKSHNVSITSGTGIASTTGSGTHNVGDTVTISATPSSTYHFSSWTVDSGGVTLASTTNSSTTFTMPDNDVTITANGAINTHTVSITSGTGISSTTGAGTYSVGQTVNISASPSSGYNFSSWTVNSGGASLASTTSSSTSFTMPDANVTITANGVLAVQNCSSTVHPTTTTGCKMADGRTWILGYNGNSAPWTTFFNLGPGDILRDPSYCPSGYSAPNRSDYNTLAASYSGGGLYTTLGLSNVSNRGFWSYEPDASSQKAYFLFVSQYSAGLNISTLYMSHYLLCVK